jgi:hypothetical protein
VRRAVRAVVKEGLGEVDESHGFRTLEVGSWK